MARKDSEKPKEVIQSYYVTSAKYDFSVYEKRILYRIVELIQAELRGHPIGEGISIEPQLYSGDRTITMPVSKFLKAGEEDKNHYQIKKAFHRLNRLSIVYEDKKVWEVFCVVTKAKLFKYESIVKFEIVERLYLDLLNFAKGYSQYELQIAFNFKSQYTMRFYELISRCGRPSITYSIEKLREMFLLEKRYKRTTDFFLKVIDPAQKELEKSKSPYWFTYKKIKIGRGFKNVQLNVHYRPDFDKKLPQTTSMRWDVDKQLLTLLNTSFGTDDKTWQPHRELLAKVQKADYNEIKKVLRRARTARNAIGYTVNAFKKMITL